MNYLRMRGVTLLFLIAAFTLVWYVGRWQPFPFGSRPAPPQQEDPYRPIELPADVAARLVVRDHPWPHPDPFAEPSRFLGEKPQPWAAYLEAALAAFKQRYPNVETVLDLQSFADNQGADQSEQPADVVALWWDGIWPDPERLVPVERYLSAELAAEYHPLSWRLLTFQNRIIGWPRWVALHYWLAPATSPVSNFVETGWKLTGELDGDSAEVLVPEFAVGALMELAAGTFAVAGDDQTGGAEAATPLPPAVDRADLTAVLSALGERIPSADQRSQDLIQSLIAGEFALAAGFGPVVNHWAVTPASSGRERPVELLLLPTPVVTGEPSPAPVMSAGAYGVLKHTGPNERVRAQLAMELAQHLSQWQPHAAIAQMSAFPAHRPSLEVWRDQTSLPEPVAVKMLQDAAYAGSFGVRAYGRPHAEAQPLRQSVIQGLWQEWLAGNLPAEELAEQLLPTLPRN